MFQKSGRKRTGSGRGDENNSGITHDMDFDCPFSVSEANMFFYPIFNSHKIDRRIILARHFFLVNCLTWIIHGLKLTGCPISNIISMFKVGGEMVSTEVMIQRLHVEVPPTSLKRWTKVIAEQLPIAA